MQRSQSDNSYQTPTELISFTHIVRAAANVIHITTLPALVHLKEDQTVKVAHAQSLMVTFQIGTAPRT